MVRRTAGDGWVGGWVGSRDVPYIPFRKPSMVADMPGGEILWV